MGVSNLFTCIPSVAPTPGVVGMTVGFTYLLEDVADKVAIDAAVLNGHL